jgi:hypothetical protein
MHPGAPRDDPKAWLGKDQRLSSIPRFSVTMMTLIPSWMTSSTSWCIILVLMHTPPSSRQSVNEVRFLMSNDQNINNVFSHNPNHISYRKPYTYISIITNLINSIPATKLTSLHEKPSESREQFSIMRTLAVYCYSSTAVQLAVQFCCCLCWQKK